MTAKLYAALALAVMVAATGLYIKHLRTKVSDQAVKIERLESEAKLHTLAMKVLENTVLARQKAAEEVEVIKREVINEPDTGSNPAPIERALDGLRKLQGERAARSPR
ncbi:hypothetical protein [Labrys neptuniae]